MTQHKLYQTLVLSLLMGLPLSYVNQKWIHAKVPVPSVQHHFWVQKTFTDSAYDMVLMGDSRTYNGLSPAILSEVKPGLRVLNFGYADGGFNARIFRAAETKFARDAKTRILILGVSPNSMTPKRGGRNLRYLEQVNKPADHRVAYSHLVPILKHFDSFEPTWLMDQRFSTSTAIWREYHPHGWLAETWQPPNPRQQLPFFTARFKDNAASQEMADQLIAQVAQWKAQDYLIFGFRPPNTDDMVAMEDTLSGLDYVRLAERFNEVGGHWLSVRNTQWRSFDGSHLDKASAILFSEAMRDSVRAYLD
jgi:hypothetical protein